mmetsp:Transcript_4849/g.13603  ORF Transcript_4849/g.13603 Transcript_4849/m.13603 type:complete len:189 (-) Transcript_4849:333-899(-)
MTMMWSRHARRRRWIDAIKLLILGSSWTVCLITLGTSPSFELVSSHGRHVPKLVPQSQASWCAAPRAAVRECQKTTTTTTTATANHTDLNSRNHCQTEQALQTKCQQAVQEAYRFLNVGGCLRDNQWLLLCRIEWCHDNDNTGKQRQQQRQQLVCERECAAPQTRLEQCIERTVQRYLRSYNIVGGGS